DYPKDKCVHELFEEQARNHPERVALVFADDRMTYGELDARSNQLAWKLREEHGVGPDVLVAMLCERSLEIIIGILGILKAGGAYVPIDPEYPESRIRYMLEDCGADVVITNVDDPNGVPEGIQRLDLRESRSYASNADPLPRFSKSSNLIYCIYT